MAVGDQAKKGEQSKIDIAGSLSTVRTAVTAPPKIPAADTVGMAKEEVNTQSDVILNVCPKKEDILGICGKLLSFCEENVRTILKILDGGTAEGMELHCDLEGERCSKDVVAEDCPIKAMFECRDSYKNCGSASETCGKFDKMATCPFADKKKMARCDYWFRLWKSSLSNKNSNKNLTDLVCGEAVFTSGDYRGDPLPHSVAECCNATPIPDKTEMVLKVRPIYSDSYNLNVNQSGYGVRFYGEGEDIEKKDKTEEDIKKEIEAKSEGQTRGEHKGVDIKNNVPHSVDKNSEFYKNVVLNNKDYVDDNRGNGFIYCAADGKLCSVVDNGNSGGWTVMVKHPKSLTGSKVDFFTTYMHMSRPPKCNVDFFQGQRMGLNPYNKKGVRAPFSGKILYHCKCMEKNIWGAGRIYDVILGSSMDEEVYMSYNPGELFDQAVNRMAENVTTTPALRKILQNISWESHGYLLDYFSKYKMQAVVYEKKDKTLTDLKLFFARLWIPYEAGETDNPVKAGDIIGFEANTGLNLTDGSNQHLHFEISKTQIKGRLNSYKVLDSSIPPPSQYLK